MLHTAVHRLFSRCSTRFALRRWRWHQDALGGGLSERRWAGADMWRPTRSAVWNRELRIAAEGTGSMVCDFESWQRDVGSAVDVAPRFTRAPLCLSLW